MRRLSRGEKVFQPHRTHYYQRLLQLGFNHKQVTLVEYLIMVLLGVSAVLYVRAGGLFAPFAIAAWLTLFTLAILKIGALERGDRLFWERRTLLLITADMVAIVAAYLGAYFLRMNFHFTEPEGRAVLRALPIVLVVRSACFSGTDSTAACGATPACRTWCASSRLSARIGHDSGRGGAAVPLHCVPAHAVRD